MLDRDDKVKVTDFGLSKYIASKNRGMNDKFVMTGETGSYRYMAPEVFKHESYDEKVDVFSYSLIVYWLFTGLRPFVHLRDPVAAVRYSALEQGRPPLGILKWESMRELLKRCWAQLADDRPQFSDVLESLERMQEDGEFAQKCSCM